MNKHIGDSLDDFLSEHNILEETEARAAKRVIAWQISQAMEAQGISKTELAKRLKTSRAAVDRILNPNHLGLTLKILEKIAMVLHQQIRIELKPNQNTSKKHHLGKKCA